MDAQCNTTDTQEFLNHRFDSYVIITNSVTTAACVKIFLWGINKNKQQNRISNIKTGCLKLLKIDWIQLQFFCGSIHIKNNKHTYNNNKFNSISLIYCITVSII